MDDEAIDLFTVETYEDPDAEPGEGVEPEAEDLLEDEQFSDDPGYLDQSTDNPDLHLDTSGSLPPERIEVTGAFDSPTPSGHEASVLAVVPGDTSDGLAHWVPVSSLGITGGEPPAPTGPGIVTISGAPVTIGAGVVVIGVE